VSVRKTFTFGLERVRELREHAESRAKEELAGSLSQRLKGAAMLARAQDELAAAKRAAAARPGEQLDPAAMVAHEHWLVVLKREEEAAALSLDRLDAEVEARRASLGDASREREVLERLKDRRRREHRAEVARRESNELDELALRMHLRGGALR
jgi:flagellar protein FliJ